jgi:dihydroorotate dehydrogenase
MASVTIWNAAFRLSKPFLHGRDAEEAHLSTLRMLSLLPPLPTRKADPILAQTVFGLNFPNPLGLAPGFDKNAEVPAQMLQLGFGFTEVGTLTPRPQSGNPKPRLFRLTEDHAVINRMGFNNEGHGKALQRLWRKRPAGIIGINIGANKDSADRAADYVAGIAAFSDIADYITVNISSPNTPGLRGLQSADELQALLKRLNEARSTQSKRPAMLLKIAPDLGQAELGDIAACCEGKTVDGVIVSNTTLSRPLLVSHLAGEAGGLSGRPLFKLSTQQLARFYLLTKGRIPLIGVGGIEDGATALQKIEAGATLLQVYSALVYKGPALITEVLTTLTVAATAAGGFDRLRGSKAEGLAHQMDEGK